MYILDDINYQQKFLFFIFFLMKQKGKQGVEIGDFFFLILRNLFSFLSLSDGMRDMKKRVFPSEIINLKELNIIFLQETH